MDKETKRKIRILIIGIVGLIALVGGVSFANFNTSVSGTKTQTMNTGCLKVVMEDEGALNIEGAVPMKDKEGLQSEPYVFTIENVCTVDAFYETTVNVMSGSNLDNLSKVKLSLGGDSYVAPKFENALPTGELLDTEITGVEQTYKIDEGYLKVGDKKEFELRVWIDYDVEQITGKLENKVIVNSIARNSSAIAYNTNTAGYYVLKASNAQLLKDVDYTKTAPDESGSGFVEASTGNGVKYYFRGTPNNLLRFGQEDGSSKLWYILSTNEDGSINIVTDNDSESSASAFYTSVVGDLETYVDTSKEFCIEKATNGVYEAKNRVENSSPSPECLGSETTTKIGNITADDLMYSGYAYNKTSTSYLSSSNLSSANMTNSYNSSNTLYYGTGGQFSSDTLANGDSYIVITLKPNTRISGLGTSASPFYVSGVYDEVTTNSTDSTNPTIVYARANEKWSNVNKSIEISAKDNDGIAGYLVQSSSTAPASNASGWEASTSDKYTTINTYDNGTYYVFAKDKSGNVSTGEQVVIERIDKVAPTCSIRINPEGTTTFYKTLTVLSNDTNIDLEGYSWDDNPLEVASVRKVTSNGVYKAYITDLAGNQGNCTATVLTTGYVQSFAYTGKAETFVVPYSGYYFIEMAGAKGGNAQGGRGAKTSGYIYLDARDVLYFYVGKQGTAANTNCRTSGYEFNGGGLSSISASNGCGGTGGGATDVRLVGGSWDDTKSLISRIMVAGGGGAGTSADTYVAPAGGTLYGDTPMHNTAANTVYLGKGGTQISGGAAPTMYSSAASNGTKGLFGKGGTGGANASSYTYGGGGGGGGYYGGSGGSGWGGNSNVPGGGGSSYISGYAGVNSVSNSTTVTHTLQTKHYSGKYFIGGDMIAGQNSGNGYANISFVGEKPERINSKLDGVRYIKNCISRNTANATNHWIEVQAIKDGVNIAKGKTVTGTTTELDARPYSRITDGDITYSLFSNPSSAADNQCVTVDLGATYDLDEVALWNYFGDQRRYINNFVYVSSDNSTWTTLHKDYWKETSNGARWNAYIDHINGYSFTGSGNTENWIWYDGFANTGSTRNTTTTTWKNLTSISSVTTNSGTIKSGTTTAATWGGNYLKLDGTDDWVSNIDLGTVASGTPTIEVVFSPSKTHDANAYLVNNAGTGGWSLYMRTGNVGVAGEYYVGGAWRNTGYDTSLTLASGTLYQYATSYDESIKMLYKSGVLLKSNSANPGSVTMPASGSTVKFGSNSSGSSNFFGGKIYSIRVYSMPLTDAQIYRNYLYDKQLFGLS